MKLGHDGLSGPLAERLLQAWEWVNQEFPFRGYIHPARRESYVGMAYTASKFLAGKGRILDFGCGPLDKTAMFAKVGLEVTAFDDFQDSWHRHGTNLARIRGFAKCAGIDLRIGSDEGVMELGSDYDMIMLHHVLEHLADSPRHLLVSLISRLRPGGLLYVTVPNAVNFRKRLAVLRGKTNYPRYASYYWSPGVYRGHIREYVLDDLAQLSRNLGLEPVLLSHYNHFWNAVPGRLRWLVRLACRLMPSGCDSCSLVAKRPLSWQIPKELTSDQVNDALAGSVPFDYAIVNE